MITDANKRILPSGFDANLSGAPAADAQRVDDDSIRSISQHWGVPADTGGGAYVGGNVNAGGKFVGRDDFSVATTGPVWQTVIVSPSQVIPLAAQPPAPPPLFVGRQAELRQLQAWLTAVTPDFLRNEGHPAGKMGLIYGPEGVGKSSLIRRWLADLRASQQPPIITHIGFDLRVLVAAKVNQPIGRHRSMGYIGHHWTPLASMGLRQKRPSLITCPQPFAWAVVRGWRWRRSWPYRANRCARPWRGEAWTVALRFDNPLPPADALTTLLALAASERRPVIVACEGLQHCSQAWFDLLKSWEKTIRTKQWPVLLLLDYDYPHSLTAPLDAAAIDARLAWLRQQGGAPPFLAEAIQLGLLTRHEIAEILLPDSQQYAQDLFLMSDGLPNLVRELLAWWRDRGVAEEALTGYWTIKRLPTDTYRFTENDLAHTIDQALARSAELTAELGYDLSAAELLKWLNHAVWEGDAFHDQALALAIGWQGDSFNDFLTIVDEALCQSEQHPQGLLIEVEGMIALAYGDNQTRYLTRYRFVQPLVAVLLRQRQGHHQRLCTGQAYAQALEKVYVPYNEQTLETLSTIYQSLGLVKIAVHYHYRKQKITYLVQEEATLAELFSFIQGEEEQTLLLRRILRFCIDTSHYLHREQILLWLKKALSLKSQLHDEKYVATTAHEIGFIYRILDNYQQALQCFQHALSMYDLNETQNTATTLTNIGAVYYLMGDYESALVYHSQALTLYTSLDDTVGKAHVLHEIGVAYFGLDNLQQALEYYQQALPLHREADDTQGENTTLNNMGTVYTELRNYKQALAYYQQTLLLRRQLNDIVGEGETVYNMGRVYAALGDKAQALAYYEQALTLQRQVGNKHSEASTILYIAHTYDALGDLAQAEKYFDLSIDLAKATAHPRLQNYMTCLEEFQRKRSGAS
ncbi:MAG: tetratricopeptide repeat protein [Caldilineaceae bacterium]